MDCYYIINYTQSDGRRGFPRVFPNTHGAGLGSTGGCVGGEGVMMGR